jgi:hypothetical protein
MSILLENLDGKFQVDEVVLGEEDVEYDVIRGGDRAGGVRFEGGDEVDARS